MNRHDHIRGMTLVEVTVALALLALLSVGLISAFQLGQRTFTQATQADAASAEILAAQRFLRSTLESSYPFRATLAGSRPLFGLEGDRETLEVTAPMPQAGASLGHYRYEFVLAARADGTCDLVVRAGLDRNGPSAMLIEETLIERVRAVEWSYRESAEHADWADHWSARREMPLLVRLRVSFPPNDPRHWPELIASPRVTDDANCEYDVVAQACRGEST